jgi:hypothetical protein
VDLSSQKKYHKRSVDLGCAATNTLQRLQRQDAIDEAGVFTFHNQCRAFIIAVIEKLRERMVKGMDFLKRASSLNPVNLEKLGKKRILERFKRLVYSLTSRSIVKAHEGDESIIAFQRVIDSPTYQSQFRAYKDENKRLDHFYFRAVDIQQHSPSLSRVIQVVMVMFHGQADVERGFSTNSGLLQNNMQELTIISRRRIKDYLYANSIHAYEVNLTTDLMQSVRAASSGYRVYLSEKKRMADVERSRSKAEEFRKQLKICMEKKEKE